MGDKIATGASVRLTFAAPGASAVNDVAAEGSSAALARADHKHGRESQQAAVTSLTDNTGGTADNTLADVPTDTLANAVAVIENNLADLAAKVNSVLTALRNIGIIAS